MRLEPITNKRLDSNDDFRIQAQPPNKDLYAALYGFLCVAAPSSAKSIRDEAGPLIQARMLEFLMQADPGVRTSMLSSWLNNPKYVSEESRERLTKALVKAGILNERPVLPARTD